jgi:hypothetical protein
MRINQAVLRAAVSTAQLAEVFGSEDVARETVEAAAHKQEQETLRRVIIQAEQAAASSFPEFENPWVVLSWFADQLRKDLHDAGEETVAYAPAEGDVVQLTIIGSLNSFEVTHPSMVPPTETVWEMDASEAGIILPLTTEDFKSLDMVRILSAE